MAESYTEPFLPEVAYSPILGGSATQASAGTTKYGSSGGSGNRNTYFSGRGGGGGWGGGGGGNNDQGCPGTDCYGAGGDAGPGTTEYQIWSQSTGIGELYNGYYYLGGGAAGYSQGQGNLAKGTGANTSGYNGSGFVMVRYLKSAVA